MKEIFKAGFFRLLFLGFIFLTGFFIAAIAGTDVFGIISLMIVNAALLHLVKGFGAAGLLIIESPTAVFSCGAKPGGVLIDVFNLL